MKYGNRPIWKRIIASPVALVVSLVIFTLLANASWGVYNKARSSSERLDEARLQLVKMKERRDDLSDKVAHLSTEQGIETEVRTKFHAVKDGESVAVIVDENHTASVNDASSVVATTTVGWWNRILHVFGF